jgi:hypothetical protein
MQRDCTFTGLSAEKQGKTAFRARKKAHRMRNVWNTQYSL